MSKLSMFEVYNLKNKQVEFIIILIEIQVMETTVFSTKFNFFLENLIITYFKCFNVYRCTLYLHYISS